MRMPVCCYPSVRSLTLGVSARRNECSSVGAQYILLPFHLGISVLHRWKVNVWMNELREMRMVSVLKANFVRKFACNMKVIFYFYSITKSGGGDDRSTSNRKIERENISLSVPLSVDKTEHSGWVNWVVKRFLEPFVGWIVVLVVISVVYSHYKSNSTKAAPLLLFPAAAAARCCCVHFFFFLFSPFVCGLFHFFLDVDVAIQ